MEVHGFQQGEVLAEGVPQPQSRQSVALGKSPENHQIFKVVEVIQQGVGCRVIQEVAEALVHRQQRAAGGAAIQNAL